VTPDAVGHEPREIFATLASHVLYRRGGQCVDGRSGLKRSRRDSSQSCPSTSICSAAPARKESFA
jgi:hypothetical protein